MCMPWFCHKIDLVQQHNVKSSQLLGSLVLLRGESGNFSHVSDIQGRKGYRNCV